MGQIVSTAANPKRCNKNKLSQLGVLAAGLHVLVSSDNSMNAAGQGNFDCYIIGDGSHVATALELKPINPKEAEMYAEINGQDTAITPTWTGSKRMVEGGSLVNASTAFSVSDYIQVNKDATTTLYGLHPAANVTTPSIHFYDSSKVYLGFLYATGEKNITENINSLNAAYIRICHYEDSNFPRANVVMNEYVPPKFADKQEFLNATNYITPASIVDLEMNIGLIGTADGIPYPNHPESLYTQSYPCGIGKTFYMENVAGVTIQGQCIHYYNGDTHVGYKALATTIADYTTIAASSPYDNIRFCFMTSESSVATSAISVKTDRNEIVIPVKEVVDEQGERISALENAGDSKQAQIDTINNGWRDASSDDFTQSVDGKFKIENGSLYGLHASSDPSVMMIFNENIKAIEFEIASLWDSNLLTLVFGVGVDTGNNKPCFAQCYLNTSSRPTDTGGVTNKDFDGNASAAESSSIWGAGHFSGDYRQSQIRPYSVAVGDVCRIELIDGYFFKASVYDSTCGCWRFWWYLDTSGDWNNPNRMGWSTRKAIGFAIQFATINAWKELIKNVKVTSESNKTSFIYSELSKNFPARKQWVAIGDSITQINNNNGLSYVGFAQRELGYNVNNQGKGGWTIYKLWRDRATAGWENAVSALNDGDIITFLAGTNDFDTAALSTPVSDEAMDAAGNPHPRFGTTDPTSQDAKDPHTTLGCLRLLIERILELKPSARLIVFSPFYREKGALIGSTGWEKLYINSDGKTIYDYADAIYSVAKEYNLPAYNTCRECGINIQTLPTYTYDDLHTGQLGGELIGEYVAKRIKP